MAAAAQPVTDALQPLKQCKSYELIPPDMSDQGMEPEDAGLTMIIKSKQPSLNLVLCGRRGAGKTSASESILGRSELHPVSSSSECVLNQGEVCGRWVSLVELPALSGKPQQEVMEESFRCISLCGPEGVHAFILVLPVGPLTDEDKGELQTIQDTFSSRVNDFTMILFTVDSDPTAPAVVDFVEKDRDVQELLQSCGGRYVILSLKEKQQIPELLERVEKISVEWSRCFSTRMFSRVYTEKISKLQAELQDVKQRSETGGDQREHLKTEEIEEMKRKEEDSKKKHREDLKTLRAQIEQERQEKIQKLKEKDENMERERERRKKEHKEEEKKRKKQEAQKQEWKLKLEASERKCQLEKEQRENTEKKLDQCIRERKRDRDAWDKERDQIWKRIHQDLKQNLDETKKNLEEERLSHKKLQEESYQKRRKWSYAWFALLSPVIFMLFYVYQSLVQTTQRDL